VLDLLDLSRIESAPRGDEIADVRRGVELALAGHRRAAAAKDLTLSADLGSVTGQDVVVRCSPTDLAIVLDNVLANAIAYTEKGSVTVRLAAETDEILVEVADTGIGIPAEDVERVFERFYRVDRGRSRTSGGTGLGLSLVRNVVEHAEGSVAIVSELGRGTNVTIRLPRVR
jgi:signal transduction histidine kinase